MFPKTIHISSSFDQWHPECSGDKKRKALRLPQDRTNRFAIPPKKRFRKRKNKNLVIVFWNCLSLSCTFQLHCTLCQSYPELLLDSVHGAILFWAVRCTPHGLHRLRTSCRSPVSITCAALTRSRASSVGDALNSVTMVCMASCSGRRACWSCSVAAAHFARASAGISVLLLSARRQGT